MIVAKLYTLFILSLAIGAIATTVTQTKFFRPFRQLVAHRKIPMNEVFQCPYCFSHWLALFCTIMYRPALLDLDWLSTIMVDTFALVAVSTWWMFLLLKALILMDQTHDAE